MVPRASTIWLVRENPGPRNLPRASNIWGCNGVLAFAVFRSVSPGDNEKTNSLILFINGAEICSAWRPFKILSTSASTEGCEEASRSNLNTAFPAILEPGILSKTQQDFSYHRWQPHSPDPCLWLPGLLWCPTCPASPHRLGLALLAALHHARQFHSPHGFCQGLVEHRRLFPQGFGSSLFLSLLSPFSAFTTLQRCTRDSCGAMYFSPSGLVHSFGSWLQRFLNGD